MALADPSPQGAQAALFDEAPTLGVSELVARVDRALRSAFPDEVWVKGEISGLRDANRNGHQYFSLVEKTTRAGPVPTVAVALLDRTRRQLLAQAPELRLADELEVRVRGRVQQFMGRVQLTISAIDPAFTLGRLALARERALRALAADGLLDRNGRLPFPVAPLRIGLVTSVGSAAYHDVIHELEASGIGFDVRVADAQVQGAGAEASVLAALHHLRSEAVDVVLVVRGGGARSDLVAFDSERVARAVATMPVPVLTGIGHEIDTTVVDAVAHRRAKTPTACAAAVVDQVRAGQARVEAVWAGVATGSRMLVARADERVASAVTRLGPGRLGHRLDAEDRHLVQLGARAARSATALLARADGVVDLGDARLRAVDPERLVARGWSITRRPDGRALRHIDEVAVGDLLLTTVAGGRIASRVAEITADVAPPPQPGPTEEAS